MPKHYLTPTLQSEIGKAVVHERMKNRDFSPWKKAKKIKKKKQRASTMEMMNERVRKFTEEVNRRKNGS